MCEKGKDYDVYNNGGYECWRTPLGKFKGIKCRYLLKKNPLIIIGCNPSTANEKRVDPTMLLVDDFCQRNGYGGYIMLNLYPQIASKVGKLKNNFNDKIHSINIQLIERIIKENNRSDILFAFG